MCTVISLQTSICDAVVECSPKGFCQAACHGLDRLGAVSQRTELSSQGMFSVNYAETRDHNGESHKNLIIWNL